MSRLTRLSSLVGSWVAWWLLVIGIKAGPAIAAIVRATSGGGSEGSSVNLSFGDGGFTLKVARLGETVYQSSTSMMSLVLWLGVPPLLLWVAWALLRRREERRQRETIGA